MMCKKIYSLANLINSQMQNYDSVEITKALKLLFKNTDIYELLFNKDCEKSDAISNKKFQEILSSFNEKSLKRKEQGVYYTSEDVSQYIVVNSIMNKYKEQTRVFSYREGLRKLQRLPKKQIEDLIFNMRIIDPTCGSGEFLITSFNIKNELSVKTTDEEILRITKTIFGNDIDEFSILICKTRLFFHICEKLENKTSYVKLAKIIYKQFFHEDFVLKHDKINLKFDIAIGNPPYVEYSKYCDSSLLKNNFGNIYADVLKNSLDILREDGVMGYIIPISYSSTPRMKTLREYINSRVELQFLLSFADRPDCLFNGVHQKLNILIAKKGYKQSKIYTSNYKYWYKDEREKLFDNISVIKNTSIQSNFVPKIGNAIERSIYNKTFSAYKTNINSFMEKTKHMIYLNMRSCFWTKAFTFNPESKEYKEFCFSEQYRNYILCILNSSLFWFFWVTVSDCWHITEKDLNNFYIPVISKTSNYNKLAIELEDKLEKTKKYIGSKQTEYEYKHRLCKDIIDKIDDEISGAYNLTPEELEYIKNFALKYRKGDDSIE